MRGKPISQTSQMKALEFCSSAGDRATTLTSGSAYEY